MDGGCGGCRADGVLLAAGSANPISAGRRAASLGPWPWSRADRGCPHLCVSPPQAWRARPTRCVPMPTPGPPLPPPPVSPWLSATATTGTWRSSSTPAVRAAGAWKSRGFGGGWAWPPKTSGLGAAVSPFRPPPRAPPAPPGDGGRHHELPRVRGAHPEPPGLRADSQEGRQRRETGDGARPEPARGEDNGVGGT